MDINPRKKLFTQDSDDFSGLDDFEERTPSASPSQTFASTGLNTPDIIRFTELSVSSPVSWPLPQQSNHEPHFQSPQKTARRQLLRSEPKMPNEEFLTGQLHKMPSLESWNGIDSSSEKHVLSNTSSPNSSFISINTEFSSSSRSLLETLSSSSSSSCSSCTTFSGFSKTRSMDQLLPNRNPPPSFPGPRQLNFESLKCKPNKMSFSRSPCSLDNLFTNNSFHDNPSPPSYENNPLSYENNPLSYENNPLSHENNPFTKKSNDNISSTNNLSDTNPHLTSSLNNILNTNDTNNDNTTHNSNVLKKKLSLNLERPRSSSFISPRNSPLWPPRSHQTTPQKRGANSDHDHYLYTEETNHSFEESSNPTVFQCPSFQPLNLSPNISPRLSRGSSPIFSHSKSAENLENLVEPPQLCSSQPMPSSSISLPTIPMTAPQQLRNTRQQYGRPQRANSAIGPQLLLQMHRGEIKPKTPKLDPFFSPTLPRPMLSDETNLISSPSFRAKREDSIDLILPTIEGHSDDVNYISSSTMVELLEGKYRDQFEWLYVFDCRYDYEYDGGHIVGAMHLDGPSLLEPIFNHNLFQSRAVIVFYCEFSRERGPKGFREMRKLDVDSVHRGFHSSRRYSNLYVLKGGYRSFNKDYPRFCQGGYVKMYDKQHLVQMQANTKARRNSLCLHRTSSLISERPSLQLPDTQLIRHLHEIHSKGQKSIFDKDPKQEYPNE